jgi:RNA polymerase sigma-70 factor (ECF subfamily)
MLEDRRLLKRFKNGSTDALQCIYEKYENYLLTLAAALLGDSNAAEDVLHDVFCNFIEGRKRIKLRGNLKGYLGTCVANLARDRIRSRSRVSVGLEATEPIVSDAYNTPQKLGAK